MHARIVAKVYSEYPDYYPTEIEDKELSVSLEDLFSPVCLTVECVLERTGETYPIDKRHLRGHRIVISTLE
ncbi:MAG: hypothetical protein ABFD50_04605 [Smithella sp.]